MLNDVSVDYGTVALLAFVVWLDGWRRLGPDAVLVTRSGLGPWTVRAPWARTGPLALVASWAPAIVPLVLAPESSGEPLAAARWRTDFGLVAARTARRLRRVRAVSALLRALGVLLTAWIIIGIPVATARFSAPGLIYGVIAAFLLALALTFGTTISLIALGSSVGRALRAAAQLLSPFTAPRAVEIVTTAAVGPLHSLAPLAALMGDARFLAWLRPWAYDALAGRPRDIAAENATIARLVGALPRSVLEDAVALTPRDATDDGARYCPRCTRTYQDSVATCAHCDDISLVATHRRATASSRV